MCLGSEMKILLSRGGNGELLGHCFSHCFKTGCNVFVIVVVTAELKCIRITQTQVFCLVKTRRLIGSGECCKHEAIDFS